MRADFIQFGIRIRQPLIRVGLVGGFDDPAWKRNDSRCKAAAITKRWWRGNLTVTGMTQTKSKVLLKKRRSFHSPTIGISSLSRTGWWVIGRIRRERRIPR